MISNTQERLRHAPSHHSQCCRQRLIVSKSPSELEPRHYAVYGVGEFSHFFVFVIVVGLVMVYVEAPLLVGQSLIVDTTVVSLPGCVTVETFVTVVVPAG